MRFAAAPEFTVKKFSVKQDFEILLLKTTNQEMNLILHSLLDQIICYKIDIFTFWIVVNMKPL